MSNGSARQSASAAGQTGRKSPRRAKSAASARPRGERAGAQKRRGGAARTERARSARNRATQYVERTAQGVANAAQQVRSLEGELMRGARQLLRSHPVWFYGGAFVTGLALARLLKATPPHEATPPRQLSSELALREGGFQ